MDNNLLSPALARDIVARIVAAARYYDGTMESFLVYGYFRNSILIDYGVTEAEVIAMAGIDIPWALIDCTLNDWETLVYRAERAELAELAGDAPARLPRKAGWLERELLAA